MDDTLFDSDDRNFLRRLIKNRSSPFEVFGIPPELDKTNAATLRSRLLTAVGEAARDGRLDDVTITVTNHASESPIRQSGKGPTNPNRTVQGLAGPGDDVPGGDSDTLSIEDRASYFVATDPLYSFESLVLPRPVLERLLLAVDTVELRTLVFDTWNLRSIQPRPSSAINLHGNPGTGKTLAAHAIASRLGRKILCSRHSQLESKYHGEGPKNLDALFYAAKSQNALLFLDEADSLMSRRFENVSQGSEQAVNSMRSELLMCLDQFEGLVIFATNFVQSYDSAFDSRVRHVEIPDPDFDARREIWRRHLPAELPVAKDLSLNDLAAIDEINGREIRRAIIDAAVGVAREGRPEITQRDLLTAIEEVKNTRLTLDNPKPTPSTPDDETAEAIKTAVRDVPAE